jgi:hypothetical protein
MVERSRSRGCTQSFIRVNALVHGVERLSGGGGAKGAILHEWVLQRMPSSRGLLVAVLPDLFFDLGDDLVEGMFGRGIEEVNAAGVLASAFESAGAADLGHGHFAEVVVAEGVGEQLDFFIGEVGLDRGEALLDGKVHGDGGDGVDRALGLAGLVVEAQVLDAGVLEEALLALDAAEVAAGERAFAQVPEQLLLGEAVVVEAQALEEGDAFFGRAPVGGDGAVDFDVEEVLDRAAGEVLAAVAVGAVDLAAAAAGIFDLGVAGDGDHADLLGDQVELNHHDHVGVGRFLFQFLVGVGRAGGQRAAGVAAVESEEQDVEALGEVGQVLDRGGHEMLDRVGPRRLGRGRASERPFQADLHQAVAPQASRDPGLRIGGGSVIGYGSGGRGGSGVGGAVGRRGRARIFIGIGGDGVRRGCAVFSGRGRGGLIGRELYAVRPHRGRGRIFFEQQGEDVVLVYLRGFIGGIGRGGRRCVVFIEHLEQPSQGAIIGDDVDMIGRGRGRLGLGRLGSARLHPDRPADGDGGRLGNDGRGNGSWSGRSDRRGGRRGGGHCGRFGLDGRSSLGRGGLRRFGLGRGGLGQREVEAGQGVAGDGEFAGDGFIARFGQAQAMRTRRDVETHRCVNVQWLAVERDRRAGRLALDRELGRLGGP